MLVTPNCTSKVSCSSYVIYEYLCFDKQRFLYSEPLVRTEFPAFHNNLSDLAGLE